MPDWGYYYRLEQLDQPVPGSYNGRWEMVAIPSSEVIGGEEIEQLAWREIRFYKTKNPRVIWASVPYDMGIETAAETIAERLGIVELEDDLEVDIGNLGQPNDLS